MKEYKMDPFDVVIRVPEDPDNKSAVICMYKGPENNGSTFINGKGKDILAMTLMFLDHLKDCLDREQKTEFIKILGEHLVEMTKDVDGIEAMMVRRRAADDDEND